VRSRKQWTGRFGLVLGIITASMAFASSAYADEIVNSLDTTSDATLEVVALDVQANRSTTISVTPTKDIDKNGCNLQGTADSITFSVTSSAPNVATVSPATITFTSCGEVETVTVTAVAPGTANISFAVSNTPAPVGTVAAAWDPSPANFSVTVRTPPAPADTTPPVISYTLNGQFPGAPDGDGGWWKSDVSLVWTVSEPESPTSLAKTGCVNQNVTSDQAATTYSCSATSTGGSAGPVSVSIKRDATPPNLTVLSVKNADGSTYTPGTWTKQDVTVTFSCTDATSGVASPAAPVTKGEGENQTAAGTCTDNAGNSSSESAGDIDVDKTKPTLGITGAADGASTSVCSLPSKPTFAPSDALSGLDGTQADTWTPATTPSGVGPYTYTATATDRAGNVATETRTYTVTYGAAVAAVPFLQPINTDGSSRFKLGSTIPVKFQALCGGVPVSTVVAKMYVAKGDSVADPGVDEAISTSAATTGNLFRYDSVDKQYIFNLSTKAGYTNPGGATVAFATGTWTLKIGLDDGTFRSVNVQLPK
jgi:hypothetical protein